MTTKDAGSGSATQSAPIIVDLGKKKKKQIKRLREGRGKLAGEVDQVIQELKSAGKIKGNAQPVVVVVREKPRNRMGRWNWS